MLAKLGCVETGAHGAAGQGILYYLNVNWIFIYIYTTILDLLWWLDAINGITLNLEMQDIREFAKFWYFCYVITY